MPIRPRLNLTEDEFERIKKLGDPSELLRSFLKQIPDGMGGWGEAEEVSKKTSFNILVKACYILAGDQLKNKIDELYPELEQRTIEKQVAYGTRNYIKGRYKGRKIEDVLKEVKHTTDNGALVFSEACDWFEVMEIVDGGRMQIKGPNKFYLWLP